MTIALKPCPFCGGEAHISGLGYCGPADCYDVYVICDGCDAQSAALIVDQHSSDVAAMEAEVAEEAAAAWNRRVEPPFAARTIAALERDLAASGAQIEGLFQENRRLREALTWLHGLDVTAREGQRAFVEWRNRAAIAREALKDVG